MPKPPLGRVVITAAVAVWLLFAVQIVAGVALATRYRPTIEQAHASVEGLRKDAVLGFLAGFHYWASALTILTAAALVALMLWAGWNRWPTRLFWWSGLAAFVLALFFQMTGNLLPFSAHDARTAYVEAGIGSQAPVVGGPLRDLVLGSNDVGRPTLERWYLAHRWVGTALLLLFILPAVIGYLKRPLAAAYAPAALAPLVAASVLAFLVGAPLGPAAAEADFGSPEARPMWYVLPMHAMLTWFNRLDPALGWVGSMLLPSLVLLALAALPFFGRGRQELTGSPIARLGLLGATAMLAAALISAGSALQDPLRESGFTVSASGETDAGPINEALAAKGREAFAKSPCFNCHMIGAEGSGKMGPNLARVGRKYPSRRWLIEKLKDPGSKSSASRMPAFDHLPEDTLRALAEYLRSLK